MITLLVGIIFLLITLLGVTVFYLVKFTRIILNVESVLEESLEVIDVSYNKMSDILEIPIFFNSPEVRRTVDEISKARQVIFNIAAALSGELAPEGQRIEEEGADESTG